MKSQPDETVALEQDNRFPSGPWTGFFIQKMNPAGRHRMELSLTFRAGAMRGEGRDWVGPFIVTGRYEVESGKCWWTKRYIGKHDVAYQGFSEGKGIWGTWEVTLMNWRGGFHIWPIAMDDPNNRKTSQAIENPDLAEVSSSLED